MANLAALRAAVFFFAICEKPEGADNCPPAVRGLKEGCHLFDTHFCRFVTDLCQKGGTLPLTLARTGGLVQTPLPEVFRR